MAFWCWGWRCPDQRHDASKLKSLFDTFCWLALKIIFNNIYNKLLKAQLNIAPFAVIEALEDEISFILKKEEVSSPTFGENNTSR